jgi:hypothetical protein
MCSQVLSSVAESVCLAGKPDQFIFNMIHCFSVLVELQYLLCCVDILYPCTSGFGTTQTKILREIKLICAFRFLYTFLQHLNNI